MASPTKAHVLNGAHTAGIFADMSVDGPEIGTLVLIVDRAKNLPNRKTIGKQDPYCAARLGKEAKKTKTDVRGGQTPKWDQELRFTVHDGPDYYQLKMSIFTDDKRTDLIGESWIDLKGIIVPGGGQNDMWQTLTCRGKYAGEIRMEITFYDSRPKPEKPAARPRVQAAAPDMEGGSMKQKTPVKRRPLPSDPVTGEAPSPAAAAPSPAQQRVPPVPDQYQTPPRSHGRHQSHTGYSANNSPAPGAEYNTPPSGYRQAHPDQYSPSPKGPSRMDRQPSRPVDSYDVSPHHHGDRDYGAGQIVQSIEPRGIPRREHHDLHMGEPNQLQFASPGDDERPPPPPAHRTRQSVGPQEIGYRNNYDSPPQKGTSPMPMRYDVLKNEAHRYSMPANSGRPSIRGHDSAPAAVNAVAHYNRIEYDVPPQRQYSYDPSYDPHHRHMQATVEDVPESPTGHYEHDTYRYNAPAPGYEEEDYHRSYEQVPSPAPLNLRVTPRNSPSPRPRASTNEIQHGYQIQSSSYTGREFSTSPGREFYGNPHSSQTHFESPDEWALQRVGPSNYAHADMPPSLVPGVDPNVAREISDRMQEERYDDRRLSYQGALVPTTRGRHMSEPPPSYGHNQPNHGYSFDSQQAERPVERHSEITYSGGSEMALTRIRNVSPNPAPNTNHAIRRKSVSPAPPPSDSRRVSDVPFGPDSFNAFNSNIPPPQDDVSGPDPDARIITHDGKEVDPSDHLPVESWAPEPESKSKQQSSDARSRSAPNGAQPMPPSGRRQLRIAARPSQPPAAPRPSYGPQELVTTVTPGRNRLQKKSNRTSAAYIQGGSSPLAPIGPDNFQDRPGQYTPTRGGQRMSHWEHQNENYAPRQGSAPPIPAKVPLPVMSGANGGGAECLALVHEMQAIDIGTGRSRRHGGY
ncbi:unnamed protein product [Clonostachys rosea f. rosea IK726]|uniref:C2 domain-containing protein n=2 Tax=Bionectria ochroleuca TaxID=29856 RepID=A0A0B7JS76_BIOOC|nr:unnamed protein product [Clonostachys rosea f. rosea IK726]